MDIELKRVYQFVKEEKPKKCYAVLVDRLWPRGISKEKLQIDEWAKQLAPSNDLRKWFAHQEERWPEFKRRYRKELEPFAGDLEVLKHLSQRQCLVLLYGSRDTQHNQAVVLRELLLDDTV